MPRIYKLSRAGLRLLYKIRHHRGHGIHSPFVFNLVTKVIEEKTPYYKYEDIKYYIDNHPYVKCKITKYDRLSFRLTNYFGVRHILEIGSGNGVNTLFLTAPNKDMECVCIETSSRKYEIARKFYQDWDRNIALLTDTELPLLTQKQDCIFINLNEFKHLDNSIVSYISSLSHEKTFIIVRGIRTNKHCKALWKSIAAMDSRTALLDLFHIGIVFFDKSLYRWRYQISF